MENQNECKRKQTATEKEINNMEKSEIKASQSTTIISQAIFKISNNKINYCNL